MSLGYSLFWRILCFGKLPIIPRHKSDRCRRNLSQSGHRNLCYLKQTLRLWSLVSSRESLLRTWLSFPLTLTEYCFPEQDFLRVHLLQEEQGWRYGKKGWDCNEMSTQCLSSANFVLECSISRYKTIFSKIFYVKLIISLFFLYANH